MANRRANSSATNALAPGIARARLRLTSLYSALFAASSGLLLLAVNLLTRHTLPSVLLAAVSGGGRVGDRGSHRPRPADVWLGPTPGSSPGTTSGSDGVSQRAISVANAAALMSAEVLRWSLLVFVATLALSVLLGYLLAGRMLRPVQAAFDSERRLVATMSHELRTPLATQRVLLETAFGADLASCPSQVAAPGTSPAQQALEQNVRASRIIDAMLALATLRNKDQLGATAPDASTPVELVSMIRAAAAEWMAAATERQVTMTANLPATLVVLGNPTLLERLVANLIANAVVHNIAGGWVRVDLVETESTAVLKVANSGPFIPATEVAQLRQPFRRGVRDRTGSARGSGLGLTIAGEIADYHRATLELAANPTGGVTATVTLPSHARPD